MPMLVEDKTRASSARTREKPFLTNGTLAPRTAWRPNANFALPPNRCVFHAISITDSTASRSGVPREADHRFHGKPIGHSTEADHLIWG